MDETAVSTAHATATMAAPTAAPFVAPIAVNLNKSNHDAPEILQTYR